MVLFCVKRFETRSRRAESKNDVGKWQTTIEKSGRRVCLGVEMNHGQTDERKTAGQKFATLDGVEGKKTRRGFSEKVIQAPLFPIRRAKPNWQAASGEPAPDFLRPLSASSG